MYSRAVAARAKLGIFCLEGDWDPNLRNRTSVRPMLELLERMGTSQFIHRDCGTPGELAFYLSKWPQRRYANYRLGYLAFHGYQGHLDVGDGVSVRGLGEQLRGKLAGRVVHLGSCSVMDADPSEMRAFLETTKAKAISGYAKDVDWTSSAAFDLLLFGELIWTGLHNPDRTFEKARTLAPGLAEDLGFRSQTLARGSARG